MVDIATPRNSGSFVDASSSACSSPPRRSIRSNSFSDHFSLETAAPGLWSAWLELQAGTAACGTSDKCALQAELKPQHSRRVSDMLDKAGDAIFKVAQCSGSAAVTGLVQIYDQADLREYQLREECADLTDANTKLKEDAWEATQNWEDKERGFRRSQAEAEGEIARLKECWAQEEMLWKESQAICSHLKTKTMVRAHTTLVASKIRGALTSWRHGTIEARVGVKQMEGSKGVSGAGSLEKALAEVEAELALERSKHRIDVQELDGMQDVMLRELEKREKQLAKLRDASRISNGGMHKLETNAAPPLKSSRTRPGRIILFCLLLLGFLWLLFNLNANVQQGCSSGCRWGLV